MAKSKLQQVLLIGVGVMVAIGFSGIFTWGGLVNSPGKGDTQEPKDLNGTLPQQNFQENGFDLSLDQQRFMAFDRDVVFVNALYQNDSSEFSDLETLPQEMNNRVYIGVSEANDSEIAGKYQIEPPQTIVIGGSPTRTQNRVLRYSMQSTSHNRSDVKDAVCGSFRELGNLAAACYS